MKLFSKNEVEQERRKETDQLLEKNSRLFDYFNRGLKKLNTLKNEYSAEKEQKLREFENFCQALLAKKSGLLAELTAILKEIEQKKDIIQGIIDRQDALDEREFLIEQKEKNLEMRTKFMEELEAKQK